MILVVERVKLVMEKLGFLSLLCAEESFGGLVKTMTPSLRIFINVTLYIGRPLGNDSWFTGDSRASLYHF